MYMTKYSLFARDGDPAYRALVLPGMGYTCQAPYLSYAAQVLHEQGWTVDSLIWDGGPSDRKEARETYDFVLRQLEAQGSQCLVVSKSLATVVLPTAVELGIPGVWLTPVFFPEVQDALSRMGGLDLPALFVGGTADESWQADRARGAGTVVEIEGGNHGLEIPGDWSASWSALGKTMNALSEFTTRLK